MPDPTRDDAIPIYTDQDFYIPYYQIKVGNRELDQETIHDIVSVSYKDSLDRIDSFELEINNWDDSNPTFADARNRTFKYSDDPRFDPGREIELYMGYYGPNSQRLMLRGEITSLSPSFPRGGATTLKISGMNLLHRLRRKQVSHRYENMTDSQIARRIGQRLGITIDTDQETARDEEPYEYILQDNQYDIIFLMERARRIGYDLFVREPHGNGASGTSTLYFGPSSTRQRVTYELVYGETLNEFSPDLTTANQVGRVTVRSWDNVRRRAITFTATRDMLRTRGVGARGRQSALEQSFGDREEVITNRPVESRAEARRLAIETLENISKDMIKGSGSTVGLPDLRTGTVIYIDGLGSRFSGRYFVTSTTHTIGDGGYETRFECRREEIDED